MADAKPPAQGPQEGSGAGKDPGLDDLDPSILDAVGAANAQLNAAASGAPAADSGGGALGQGAIDDLLSAASFEDPQVAAAVPQTADDELEKMLQESTSGADHVTGGMGGASRPASAIPVAPKFDLPSLSPAMGGGAGLASIDLLRDVELNVKIELGRSRMLVEDVLKLAEGSVVELDKLAGDPVDVFVNDRLVARGEVLVLNDNFCVRVNEIVAGLREDAL